MTSSTRPTDIFFDFLCPYAWRGLELAAVLRAGGQAFRLRHFSLVEGNHPDNAGGLTWRLTDQPLDTVGSEVHLKYQRPTLQAFLAAHAAYAQDEDAAWAFALALFRLRHEQKRELNEETFGEAAQQAGLNLDRWREARADEGKLRAQLRADLDNAAEIGVFGTPTFVLPGGEAAYYRFETLTRDPDKAQQWWTLYATVLQSDAHIGTIKRARHRPAPKH